MIKRNLTAVAIVLFILFTVNTTATVIYARSAESNAKDAAKRSQTVEQHLEALRITTQNKCIVSLVLSYPSPVPAEQLAIILAEYDACIAAQEKEIEEEIKE